jgi:hypothetical protein
MLEGKEKQNYIGVRFLPMSSLFEQTINLMLTIVLRPLFLALAYLSYWPAKGLAKIIGNENLIENTESFVDYSNVLLRKSLCHVDKVGQFINTVLSYACAAIIWTAALIITPLVWAIDKIIDKGVQSKFSDIEEPERYSSGGKSPA